MVRLVVLVLPVAALLAGAVGSPARSQVVTPNVVLILTDDQRVGLLPAMPVVRHRIQQVGVTFPNAMVPTSLCCPSRSSLLTGKFAHGTHVYGNSLPGDPLNSGGVEAFDYWGNQPESIAKVLHDTGYYTGLYGKYLNGYDPASGVPLGWDRFQAFTGLGSYYNYRFGDATYGHDPADYSTDVIADLAVQDIQSAPADQPWFFYIAPFAPHTPATPAPRHINAPVDQFIHPQDFGAFNERDVTDKPAYIQRLPLRNKHGEHAFARRQVRSLLAVDELTARVLDALGTRGVLSNTLVIYMSDNGQLWGEHRWPGKNIAYSRATDVPLLMRWYGHIPEGSTETRLALNVDVTATIAAAAGVDMPWSEGLDLLGRDARKGFVLEAIRQSPPYNVRPAYCGWRTQNRLFVHYATGEEEFYRYGSDPLERNNLADDPRYQDVIRSMREKTRAACVPVPPGFTWTP